MQYVALFRGINVGGMNAVKMDELKKLFEELGFTRVRSYIQSGNILFETELNKEAILEKLIPGFQEKFGFEAGIHLRSREELRTLVEAMPFSEDDVAAAEEADGKVAHLYVYFLNQPVWPEQLDVIRMEYDGPDLIAAGSSEIYLLTHHGVRHSRMPTRVVKTFSASTARNWNTTTRLLDLMDQK